MDTSAWIEYFQGTKKGQAVREMLDRSAVVFSAPTVIAELYSKFARSRGPDVAKGFVDFVEKSTALIETDRSLAFEAGRIHAELKRQRPDFGMADAFILAAARARRTYVVTKDSHFEGLDEAQLL